MYVACLLSPLQVTPTSIFSTASSMAAIWGPSSVRLPHSTASSPYDGSCFNHSFSDDSVSGLMGRISVNKGKTPWSNTVWWASWKHVFMKFYETCIIITHLLPAELCRGNNRVWTVLHALHQPPTHIGSRAHWSSCLPKTSMFCVWCTLRHAGIF